MVTATPVAEDAIAQATAQPATRRRRRGKLGALGPPFVVFLLFLGVWYLFTYVVLDPARRFLLPAPHEVVREFRDIEVRTELLRALGQSTWIALAGLAIAIVIGMSTAILMSQARWIERSLYPYAVVMQCIPILALVPLIAFWFDYGYTSRLIVCVMIALFPIISSTFFGLQSADQDQHDLFTLRRAGRMTRIWRLQLPAALPSILTGFQISAGASVIGAVVGDFFFKQGEPGIGILIEIYRSQIQAARMFAAVILASALGVAVFWFFGFLSRKIVGGWHGSAAYTRQA